MNTVTDFDSSFAIKNIRTFFRRTLDNPDTKEVVKRKDILLKALRNTGSIIAGGFLTKTYAGEGQTKVRGDIDIYVNQKDLTDFLTDILEIPNLSVSFQNLAGYDSSFFKKNNILFLLNCM